MGQRMLQGINLYTIWVIGFVCLGSVSYGYAASVISISLGQPSFLAYFELATRPNGTQLLSATNGLYFAGGTLSLLLLPSIADRYGRKWGIAVPAVLLLVSGALLGGSVHIGMFLVFRFISGAGAFMILLAIPVYLSEIVPPRLRGALVDAHAVGLNVGYMVAGWVGYGFFFWESESLVQWRPPFFLQAVCPIILLCGLYWMPESPRWLLMNDRAEEAQRILERLHSDSSDPGHTFALKELYQIRKQVEIDRGMPHSWKDMFRSPSNRKRTLIVTVTNSLSQCSGILVINGYGPMLYRLLGFPVQTQLVLAAAWVTVATIMNLVAAFLVDRFPRPKFIAIGLLLCAACMMVEAAIVKNFIPSTNEAALNAGVALLFIFVIFYSIFVDGTQFSYFCEIFPNHLRVKGISAAFFSGGVIDLIYLQCAPTALKNIGWKYYLVFIITTSLGAIWMWIAFPDTKNKPLEEIAAIFGDANEVAVFTADLNFEDNTICERVGIKPTMQHEEHVGN